jgi:hydroxymethylpyrimidine pyrophosphatase-like HAD family hydrolase
MCPASVSLVVTDLDGTLWHTDDHLADTVVDAFRLVQRRRVPLLVATGRRLGSTRRPLRAHGLSAPTVVLNGALGVLEDSAERFHCSPYPPAQARQVLAAFGSVGLEPVVYVDHTDWEVVLGPTPSTHPEHARALGPSAGRLEPELAIEQLTVLGFGLIGIEHGDAVAARDAIGDVAETHLDRSLDHPGLASLTVAPLGRSKWDGVLAYCAAHDLDADRVLALGDGPNDVELLDGAAVSLVPEGSHPAALERADHLIPPAKDGGWASVLAHLV